MTPTVHVFNVAARGVVGLALAARAGGATMGQAQPTPAPAGQVRLERLDQGAYRCRTDHYEAAVDALGNLASLRAGATEFLACPTGFVHAGALVRSVAVRPEGQDRTPGILRHHGQQRRR